MNQIKDQEIQGRPTRTYLCYRNDQQGTLIKQHGNPHQKNLPSPKSHFATSVIKCL